jgi:transcriptional regulator with XRE-family HTH domain
MESYEVLRDAFEKTSPKEIASEMGLSLSMVYKWAQPITEQGSGSVNPLDRAAQLMKLTRNRQIIQWLCAQSGGFFVKNPKHHEEAEHESVMPAMNEIVQQFADLLEAITTASIDQKITKPEADKIRAEWEHLKTFAETFVHACEKGDFSNLSSPKRLVAR